MMYGFVLLVLLDRDDKGTTFSVEHKHLVFLWSTQMNQTEKPYGRNLQQIDPDGVKWTISFQKFPVHDRLSLVHCVNTCNVLITLHMTSCYKLWRVVHKRMRIAGIR